MNLACFKAYDIRGRVPEEVNEELAYKLGLAFAAEYQPKKVVVGYDVRETSIALSNALIKGLRDAAVNVVSLGLCGTEEVYFQTVDLRADGGIMVTASHNPINFNGMKLVRENAIPISEATGLKVLAKRIQDENYTVSKTKGTLEDYHQKERYIQKLLSFVSLDKLKKLKIVVNAGNGCAGPIVDLLESHLPFEFIKIHHEPDGTFPNGIPNPLLIEGRKSSSDAVISNQADLGVAWDGDFDRCFFFDHKGRFIESYYVVGLLAKQLLRKHPNEKIVIDPRLIWNSLAEAKANHGECVLSQSGHAFMKAKMREVNALYGGEMSAHHYFREFTYCDSGMIPWLLVVELLSESNQTLAELVDTSIANYPCSGEINFTVKDSVATIEHVISHFEKEECHKDTLDGVSLAFADWRFNLRSSNTEPLIRLNVESRGNRPLLEEKTALITNLITHFN